MKVDCVPHSERKLLLTIVCEDEAWKEIHTSIFGRRPSLPKHCQSLVEFAEQFNALEYNLAKQYVIKRLSVQSLPSATLQRALKQRLVSESTIERVINDFQQWGYLNDSEWTKNFVRRQMDRKLGPRAIAYKLSCKGLPKEHVEGALKVSGDESQQQAAIAQLLKTRFRQRNLADFREKQKVIAALVRRGFDFSVILATLKVDSWE